MMIYLALLGSAALVGVDFVLKKLVVEYLRPIPTLPLWQDVLHLTYTENTGAAFSILGEGTRLLIALTSAALTALIGYLILKKPNSRWQVFSLMLILAGGLGNLIDRVALGYVVDYIDFRLINFAVFNFADCCAVMGTILLMAYLFFVDGYKLWLYRREQKRLASTQSADASADTQHPAAGSAESVSVPPDKTDENHG